MNERVKPTEIIRCRFLDPQGLVDISILVHTLQVRLCIWRDRSPPQDQLSCNPQSLWVPRVWIDQSPPKQPRWCQALRLSGVWQKLPT